MLAKQYVKQVNYIVGLATLLSLSSLFLDSKANALTGLLYSQTASFSNQVTELKGIPVLTLSKYNPQTGQIVTEVRFTFTGNLNTSGTVTNTAAQAQTFTFSVSATLFDLDPGANAPAALITAAALKPSGSFSPLGSSAAIGSVRYRNLAPNAPANFGPFTINNNASPLIVSFNQPTDIAGFLGTDTFSFNPFTEIATSVSGGGGNTAASIQTFASSAITVEYYGDVTPVPFELSSNVGIGSFFGVMFGLSWWKRKRHFSKCATR